MEIKETSFHGGVSIASRRRRGYFKKRNEENPILLADLEDLFSFFVAPSRGETPFQPRRGN